MTLLGYPILLSILKKSRTWRKAWFSKLTAEENLEIKTLTLYAPSNFIRDWIKNKYGYVIEQFAQELGFQFVGLVTNEQLLAYTG